MFRWILDADIIGFTVITDAATRAYELADHFRRRGVTVDNLEDPTSRSSLMLRRLTRTRDRRWIC